MSGRARRRCAGARLPKSGEGGVPFGVDRGHVRTEGPQAELECRGYHIVKEHVAEHAHTLCEEHDKWGAIMRRVGNLPAAR